MEEKSKWIRDRAGFSVLLRDGRPWASVEVAEEGYYIAFRRTGETSPIFDSEEAAIEFANKAHEIDPKGRLARSARH